MNRYYVDPSTPGLRPADRVKLARMEGRQPTPSDLAAVEAARQPRRRKIIDRFDYSQQLLPSNTSPPVAKRRLTLADARHAKPPWLPRVDHLVASGRAAYSSTVTDVSMRCAHCGVRHRSDHQCEAMRNRSGHRATLATERLS